MRNQEWAKQNSLCIKGQVRSGDILLTPVKTIPQGGNLIYEGSKYVLAVGEITGHAHVLEDVRVLVWEVSGQRYITTQGKGLIAHEEHKLVPVETHQCYLVVPEREMTLEGEWQTSTD